MPSASETAATPPPPPPAPSVFISYASEDRIAVRALRETLSAAGLDVWYDEEELTGGDAWDQKIRRQIRDCDYFMPVISATTEARKEGYFRREWRLATERSLDMADDVLFLIPVTIDGTSENGARVPDKFLTVQWLRAPNGNVTPAIHHLIRRLLAGEHHIQTRPPTRAPFQRPPPPMAQPPVLASEPPPLPPPAAAAQTSPPPMPAFPHVPEKGGFFHGIKFIAEVLWWALTAGWMLFNRLPRWARILVTIWAVLTLFSARGCNRNISIGDPDTRQKAKATGDSGPQVSREAQQAIRNAADQFAQAAREARKNGNPVDLAKLGSEIAKTFGPGAPNVPGAPDGVALGKRLVLAPFTRFASEDPADKFGGAVFTSLYGRLEITHAREVGLLRVPQGAPGDAALLARAKAIGSSFVLTGHVTGEGDARALTVHLLVIEDGSTKWTESYPVASSEPTDVADKIAEKLADVLPPRRELPPRKNN